MQLKNDSAKVRAKAAAIKVLVLDVDGVCTDGKLYAQPDGTAVKAFCSHDGVAIKTAMRAALHIAVITGRDDPAVTARFAQLGVEQYYPGFEAKLGPLEKIRQALGLEYDQMAYLGDDWIDLDPMLKVGLPLAVPNARPEVLAVALGVTARPGGEGAVRDAVEFILKSRDPNIRLTDYWMEK